MKRINKPTANKRITALLTPQTVGAFGEKAVEAELLRRGWIPSNVNATVKNAADFDIFALKAGKTVHLRVKSCGPGLNAFQFGGFRPGEEISFTDLSDTDFSILVWMGNTRDADQFFIIPTRILREQIARYRKSYLEVPKRDGGTHKDTGHWTLHLSPLRSSEDRRNYNFAEKWKSYLNNWVLLEKP